MTWFRTHLRANAGVALFALALQFVLAFGHNHGSIPLAPAASGLQGIEARASQPAGPAAAHDDDAICAICASVALAGTLVLPTAPAAERPSSAIVALLVAPPIEGLPGETLRPFQARAPPA